MTESDFMCKRCGKTAPSPDGIVHAKDCSAREPVPEAPTEGCDTHKRFIPTCDDCIAPQPTKAQAPRQVWPSFLDSREFYDLMQAYRTTPPHRFVEVNEAYEAVRFFIRDQRDAAYERLERELADAWKVLKENKVRIKDIECVKAERDQARAELELMHKGFADRTYQNEQLEKKNAALVASLKQVAEQQSDLPFIEQARDALKKHGETT